MTPRFYKIALGISLLLNIVSALGIWYYSTIEGTLAIVKSAVEMFN